MSHILLLCLYASLGTLGFGFVFNAKKDKLVFILIGGLLNIVTYELVLYYSNNLFLSSLICASVTYIYSSILAVFTKVPAIIYILTGLLPVVPGSSLFYTMQNLVLGHYDLAKQYAITTIIITLGIACGIAVFSVGMNFYKDLKRK